MYTCKRIYRKANTDVANRIRNTKMNPAAGTAAGLNNRATRQAAWAFDCLQRQNGNTRQELELRTKPTGRWMTLPGMAEVDRAQRIPWGRNYPTHLVFTTCWGTYGNGARTGSAHIPASPRLTHKDRRKVRGGSLARPRDSPTADSSWGYD